MATTVEQRALQSLGTSGTAIYEMVRRIIAERITTESSSKLLDVGCGTGNIFKFVGDLVQSYEGVDVLRYEGFPSELTFHHLNLDSGKAVLPNGYADIVIAIETIEHLENPRAFFRELTRLGKPDGWVVVTTPNQLSLLSKLTLMLKNQFNAFTDTSYPAHITALLEIDLVRIAAECGLRNVAINYTCSSRIPGTGLHWPKWFCRLNRRLFSDNIGIAGQITDNWVKT